jgi:anti-sigma factor ChrR (cupin superfamily)
VTEPAQPAALRTDRMPWIPAAPGRSFRPLRFEVDAWSELMRVEPGYGVPLHRHTGDVHAFTLSGRRRIDGSGEIVGSGDFVYEPAGTVDAWEAVGDEPCVLHLRIEGAVEFLDARGEVVARADSASQRRMFDIWSREQGLERWLGLGSVHA